MGASINDVTWREEGVPTFLVPGIKKSASKTAILVMEGRVGQICLTSWFLIWTRRGKVPPLVTAGQWDNPLQNYLLDIVFVISVKNIPLNIRPCIVLLFVDPVFRVPP